MPNGCEKIQKVGRKSSAANIGRCQRLAVAGGGTIIADNFLFIYKQDLSTFHFMAISMENKKDSVLENDSVHSKPQEFGEVENVRVVIRIRPLHDSEITSGYREIISVDGVSNTISVFNPKSTTEDLPKTFTFDIVFGTDSTQVDVYNETARPIVEKVLAGYNGTILAYGQTGTGKTFTMEGVNSKPELRGIIPNSFAHIFGFIAKAEDNMK